MPSAPRASRAHPPFPRVPGGVRRASSCREHDLGARAAQRECALELVGDERAYDREARPVARAVRPAAFVRDGEDNVAVPLRELDLDPAGAVLERVLEELAEDER